MILSRILSLLGKLELGSEYPKERMLRSKERLLVSVLICGPERTAELWQVDEKFATELQERLEEREYTTEYQGGGVR